MSIAVATPAMPKRIADAARPLYCPLITAVAYYLGAEAAFVVGTLSDKIFAPFWPPNIVLLCALLFSPYQRWWLIILAGDRFNSDELADFDAIEVSGSITTRRSHG